MEFVGSLNPDLMSDETFDLQCTMCKRKGRNREAEKYCVECNDYYCLLCVKVHEDVPSLTDHKILDHVQFPSRSSRRMRMSEKGSSKSQPAAPTERCDRHSHYYIDMYCQNHDDVGCATCMAIDHRSCKDIYYIPEYITNNPSVSVLGDVNTKLDAVTVSLRTHHEGLEKEKCRLLKRKSEVKEKIETFRKEINERLDELQKKSVADVEDKLNALLSKVGDRILMLNAATAKAKSAQEKVGSPGSNISQDFVNAKKVKSIAGSAAECTQLAENDIARIQTEDVDFTPDQKISELLGEISMLGKISAPTDSLVSKDTEPPVKERQINQSPVAGTVAQADPTIYQATGSKKYNVKIKSDKCKCDIASACVLEDGTIILSDRENEKLKRLDRCKYTVLDYCDLPGSPLQVCPVSKQEVAVCLDDIKIIQFVLVGSKMTKTKEIRTNYKCCGLAYAVGNLYISGCHKAVDIYSLSESKLTRFSKEQTGDDFSSLAVTKNGSRIYVADYEKGLLVLDNNGKAVNKFGGPRIQGAVGCFLTNTGSVLVLADLSDNVLQFGQNGDLMNEVIEFKNKKSLRNAICCNQEMSKMLIGKGENNQFDVYDIVKHSL